MPEASGQEKTEKPTNKRREEARKKGNVAKSPEVSSAFVLMAALGVFWLASGWMGGHIIAITREIFSSAGTYRLTDGASRIFLWTVFLRIGLTLLPLVLAVMVAGAAGNIIQIGFLLTGEPMAFNLSKLDPISGMKKLFSLRSFAEVLKSLLKMSFIGVVSYLVIRGELDRIPLLVHSGVAEILRFTSVVSLKIIFFSGLALIVLAAIDYPFQRWQHEEGIKMTKQEVKDENKQQEGDPLIKSRIRSTRMEMARRRMMAAVPKADVIITNPTELAIAIQYESGRMVAPQVTAKGAGYVAARIREIAKAHQVPMVEHKPLARTLYKSVDVGEVIPQELYQAVAEILAYVYRLRSVRAKGGGFTRKG